MSFLIINVASSVGATDNPNHARGFSGPFMSAGIDNVSLYNGALSMQLPLGDSYRVGGDLSYGFVLSYNSNLWDYGLVVEPTGPEITAEVSRIFNAGAGWSLHIGWLLQPAHSSTGSWMYISPDGGAHRFYDTLHRGEDDGAPPEDVWSYTRDGSYLRMTKISNSWREIEFPNGVKQVFYKSNQGPVNGYWYLDRMEDRHGNKLEVDYEFFDSENSNYPGFEEVWTLTDNHQRTHYMRFKEYTGSRWNVLEEVELAGPGGARLLYDLTFVADQNFARSCKDTAASTQNHVTFPRLGSLVMPDGSSLKMEDAGGDYYHDTCAAGIDDLPGTLFKVRLPTGGYLEWDYGEYEFPPGETNSVFNTSAGVIERRMVDSSDTTVGTWTYKSSTVSPDNGHGPEPEVHMEVGYPTGDCTKHYFSGWYYRDPNWGPDNVHRGWELGLPFVWSVESDGRYLSTEHYPSTGGSGGCTGLPLRSTYVSYTHDELPNTPSTPDSWHNSNRRLTGQRTVLHDDGGRFVDVQFSSFDGVGNYRLTETTTDINGGASGVLTRSANVEFNSTFGTYCFDPDSNAQCASHNWQMLPTNQEWVLGTFTQSSVSEPGAHGQTQLTQKFLFNSDGQLEMTRSLSANDGSLAENDVLAHYLHSANGNLQSIRVYGGDVQPLSPALSWQVPATYQFRTDLDYASGILAESRSYESTGAAVPFLNYDATIDGSGAVESTRTEALFETAFQYDGAGRMEGITPEVGAKTVYSYSDPGFLPWTVTIERVDGATVLTSETLEFDDFGRQVKLTRETADHGAVATVTTYNARGWVTSQSVDGLPGDVTSYEYDTFGRATRVTPPDGPAHDVLLTYEGVRKVVRQVSRATSLGGESYTSTETYSDGFGRMERVTQPAAPGGGLLATTYDYDVGGRLTRISSAEPLPGATQVREYVYDGLGFLRREKHPEKGLLGNDWVDYFDYDASGNVGRTIDGTSHVRSVYDALGRVVSIEDVNQADRPLVEFEYDGGSGFGAGQVWKAIRHNYRQLPWISGETDVVVTETFTYEGLQGQVSHRDTDIAPLSLSFDTGFAYNALGQLDQILYPSCASGGCAGLGRTHSVSYSYSQGQLVAIPGWATSISYHRNGLLDQIVRPNGVTDDLNRDASGLTRPKRMRTYGVEKGENWDSGVYAYDGAGSISAIGQDSFAYDGVGRLAEATVESHIRSYAYDSFGNLGSITTVFPDQTQQTYSTATDPATNRLSAATYNAAGSVEYLVSTAFEYDALERLKSRSMAGNPNFDTYVYAAGGERVWEISGDVNSTSERFSLRGLDGKVLRTWNLERENSESWSFGQDYVYRGSRLLATERPGSVVSHFHLDHLGSPRLVTDGFGSKESDHTYFPYGAELTDASQSTERMRFTGHERDTPTTGGTSSLDYMHARYFNSHYARFLRVDPVQGTPGVPQSLNRYAYTAGNPVNLIDPSGLTYWGGYIELMSWIRDYFTVNDSINVTGEMIELELLGLDWSFGVDEQIIEEIRARIAERIYSMEIEVLALREDPDDEEVMPECSGKGCDDTVSPPIDECANRPNECFARELDKSLSPADDFFNGYLPCSQLLAMGLGGEIFLAKTLPGAFATGRGWAQLKMMYELARRTGEAFQRCLGGGHPILNE